MTHQFATPPQVCVTDTQKQVLYTLRGLCEDTLSQMRDRNGGYSSAVRSNFITAANPHAVALEAQVMSALLSKANGFGKGRASDYTISNNALRKARDRLSFGPEGVLPDNLEGFRMRLETIVDAATYLMR